MTTLSSLLRNRTGVCIWIVLCSVLMFSPFAWSEVLVHWTTSALPPSGSLGFSDLVVSWDSTASPVVSAAIQQRYRVYLQTSLQQAKNAAQYGDRAGCAGIILTSPQSEREQVNTVLTSLRSAYPKLRFLVVNRDGRQPEMRGSLVVKRNAVLEVSSPTAQPWIDSNLSLVRIEDRTGEGQTPLYTFSWGRPESGEQSKELTAEDYLLALAEAGAFHADLILEVDESLQKALAQNNQRALSLWKQVRLYAKFYSAAPRLKAAANVALVVDDLESNDEVMNLLARHNIPFDVLLAADLNTQELQNFNLIVIFAKSDKGVYPRAADLAAGGKTVVVVDAHGSYPWQKGQPVQINEHAVSYAVGNGTVLELSEPVGDPETFAQDIRRLLGKQNTLVSLWNGLTTIAVPYGPDGKTVSTLELINYAEEPVRVQVQVKGLFDSILYETPEHPSYKSLPAVKHNGFTEFVIPDLWIAGRVQLGATPPNSSTPNQSHSRKSR